MVLLLSLKGHSLSIGFSAIQLRMCGYSVSELRRAGFRPAELKAAGCDAGSLREAGFNPRDLLAAKFTFMQIQAAGYSPEELNFSASPVQRKKSSKKIISVEDEPEPVRRQDALKRLKKSGQNSKMLRDAGYSLVELKAAGELKILKLKYVTVCELQS